MTPQARYQIFLSSTYDDLREERQQATQAVLEAGNFPAGMELFPASDDSQWELIKRVISESDYYIVIVGGRYGSLGPSGKSYTEMEYDFAPERKIPVLGFVKGEIENLPAKFVEGDKITRERLDLFREKVLSRTCRKFRDPLELGMAVLKSLMHEVRVRPRTGWVRAEHARTDADLQREAKLREIAEQALDEVEDLKRELRDRVVLIPELPREKLRQGDDIFDLTAIYKDANKNLVSEKVPLSYDDILRAVGPSMFGYIQRRAKEYGRPEEYAFERHLAQQVRSRIIDKCQNREIKLVQEDVDTIVFQFKELGYIMFKEKEEEDGEIFRGLTLTEAGERHLTRIVTKWK